MALEVKTTRTITRTATIELSEAEILTAIRQYVIREERSLKDCALEVVITDCDTAPEATYIHATVTATLTTEREQQTDEEIPREEQEREAAGEWDVMDDQLKSARALVAILSAIVQMSDDVKNASSPLDMQGKLLRLHNSIQKNASRMVPYITALTTEREQGETGA